MAKDKQSEDDFYWRLTSHCCRACFGRVLVRETFDRRKIFRCSNCGVEREGADSRVICTCGMKLRSKVDAGIRCVENVDRSPEWPSEIVAMAVSGTSV